MAEEAQITAATRACIEAGEPIAQIFRFGTTDRDHVSALLSWLNPPVGANILDVGCGVGTVAAIMSDLRPDLTFTLLNNNQYQLSLCPEGMNQYCGDMHGTLLPPDTFDAVMVNYSIGYADPERVFSEFYRLLKPEGVLFICDVSAPADALNVLGYKTYQPEKMIATARLGGFASNLYLAPQRIYLEKFFKILDLESDEVALKICQALTEISPAIYRFIKIKRRMDVTGKG